MRDKKYLHSIYSKVRRKTLTAALISAFTIFLIATIAIFIIRANVAEVSDSLGEQASRDSVNGITQLAESALSNAANAHTLLADKQLETISSAVSIVADAATDIMKHPDVYRPQTIGLPDPKNDGKLIAQYLLAPGTDQSSVKSELGLLANLSDLQISILENNLQDTGNESGMYIGTETGISIMVDKMSGIKTSVDSRTRPWYIDAKEEKEMIWTDVFDDIYGRGLYLTCAMPYYGKDDQIKGVVGAGIFLSTLSKTVEDAAVNKGQDRKVFIVNERGDVIIAKDVMKNSESGIVQDNLLNSSDENMRKAAKNMFERKSGIERVSLNGEDYFMAYSPMSELPWTFCVLVKSSEVLSVADITKGHISNFTNTALSNIQRIFLIILMIFGALLIVFAFAEVRVSRRLATDITGPIVTLTDNVRHMKSREDLGGDLHMETGDEIEELADAFTDMTVRLRKYIENLTMVTAEKERIGTELAVATGIQSSMLPCIFPPFPGRSEFDLYAIMDPAKEVGGDFYDFFLIDKNTLCLVVADVSGKGVPAALFMVITKTLIKNNAQDGMQPAEVFEKVNNLLCENNDANMFVTAFMGYLDIPTGHFTFVNAGHNPPLIKQTGSFKLLPLKPGFVLAGLDDTSYRSSEITLSAGDTLCLYTDGAVEAVNSDFELFSEERMIAVADSEDTSDLKTLVTDIKSAIDDFASGVEQFDDITLLAFRYNGENISQN
jgi:sigma-B regulation protein RsbU (phosphoserine phosphatase)